MRVSRVGLYIIVPSGDRVAGLPGAIPVRETIVREAIHYLDSLSTDVGGDLQFRYELASGYRRLASLQGDPFLANKGDSRAALASLDKAVWLQESVVATSPRHVPARSFSAILARRQGAAVTGLREDRGGVGRVGSSLSRDSGEDCCGTTNATESLHGGRCADALLGVRPHPGRASAKYRPGPVGTIGGLVRPSRR